MPRNLLKRAAEHLQTKMEQHASETVEYERPGLGSVDGGVLAIPGQTEAPEALLADGALGQRSVTNDFTIRRSLLVIQSERVEPESGDLIHHTTGGYRLTYTVSSDLGLSPADPSDPYDIAIRIHCDLTNVGQVP